MSDTTAETFKLVANLSTIYVGFFVFVFGMIGNTLNTIVFTSLNTFRETSAAFYMTAASIFNLIQLIAGLLSRIMITGFNIDPTQSSIFICKLRPFILYMTIFMASICMCLAAIDQFLSRTERWHHLCTTIVARRLVAVALVGCCLHGIPTLVFQEHVLSLSAGQTSCSTANDGYKIYLSRVLTPILLGLLPLLIRSTFGLLAFIKVRALQNRQVPTVRLERDKQLTTMV